VKRATHPMLNSSVLTLAPRTSGFILSDLHRASAPSQSHNILQHRD
jgi:hypothetical protein